MTRPTRPRPLMRRPALDARPYAIEEQTGKYVGNCWRVVERADNVVELEEKWRRRGVSSYRRRLVHILTVEEADHARSSER